MPAEDRYHKTVVHTLEKAGWTITAEQFPILLTERHLWIDIRAVRDSDNFAILIEVKGFENARSPIEYLASAVGKYILYRTALDYLKIRTPLYLAVPLSAYNGLLNEELGQQVLEKVEIRLMVFDPSKEEIVLWKH